MLLLLSPSHLSVSLLHPTRPSHLTFLPQGSEVTYIYSCILLAAVPLICAGAGYATVKFQNSRRRHFRTLQEENNNGRSVDKMMVKEWLHQVRLGSWETREREGPELFTKLLNG